MKGKNMFENERAVFSSIYYVYNTNHSNVLLMKKYK